ncbi:MAG: hypothetical protein U0929_15255 [Planctomycetaceae bacterium]
MIDTTEEIRDQMEVTKSQLTDKLESLELQVAGTVQSASTAVTTTVEAVQDAVSSVRNTFDLQRITNSHPWLVVGGAVAVGYLATKAFVPHEVADNTRVPVPPSPATADRAEYQNGTSNTHTDSRANTARIATESTTTDSVWDQMRMAAVGAFIGIASEMASQAAPLLMEYLSSPSRRGPNGNEPRSLNKEMI